MPVAASTNGISKIGTAYGIGKRYGARTEVNSRRASYASPTVTTSTSTKDMRCPGAGDISISGSTAAGETRGTASLPSDRARHGCQDRAPTEGAGGTEPRVPQSPIE